MDTFTRGLQLQEDYIKDQLTVFLNSHVTKPTEIKNHVNKDWITEEDTYWLICSQKSTKEKKKKRQNQLWGVNVTIIAA